jgi:two-component system, OmpR family, sensor histidine kinase KdpD
LSRLDALARIRGRSPARAIASSVIAPGAATLLALVLPHRSPASGASVYILGVVAAAGFGGAWSGVAAAALSFIGLNYFFTVPYHTFEVQRADDLVALAVFVVVAAFVGALVARVVEERDRAERTTSEAKGLAAFTGRLLSEEPVETSLRVAAQSLVSLFELSACAIEAVVENESIRARAPAAGQEPEPSFEIPLRSGSKDLGRMMVSRSEGRPDLSKRELEAIGAFAGQVAMALQRATYDAEIRRTRVEAEASDMRAALFSSITHDLRTPLASITAAVSSLLDPEMASDSEGREELLRTSLEEAHRLNRMVANLLDLARFRAGALKPATEPMPIEDVVESVLRRMEGVLRPFRVRTFIRPDLPLVAIDPIQVDQALTNIIENASRFSLPGSEIRVTAHGWQSRVEVRVVDEGPGIPAEERERVFEPFYKQDAGLGRGGTGLGLAIARAVVQVHGGRIRIEGTPAGGTAVVFDLPVAAHDRVGTHPQP